MIFFHLSKINVFRDIPIVTSLSENIPCLQLHFKYTSRKLLPQKQGNRYIFLVIYRIKELLIKHTLVSLIQR